MQLDYRLIDTHVHLEHADYERDLDAVVARARDAGVRYLVAPACKAADAGRALALARRVEGVYFGAGLHPNEGRPLSADEEKGIRDALTAGKEEGFAVAVCECGLDYHYMALPREEQLALVRWHLGLARELDLPVILHQRDAEEDLRRLLEEEGAPPRGAVLHCFGGSADYYRWARGRGLHVSFTGSITFRGKKNAAAPPYVRGLELGAAMLETDGPYMAPEPHRGRRNEPSRLPLVAQALATLAARPLEDVYAETTLAARRFFALPPDFGGVIAYPFKRALYLNVTNRCTNRCVFCVRDFAAGVGGHDLRLRMEPTVEETVAAVGDAAAYDEVVFCGFGEPTVRWDAVIAMAREIKRRGGRTRLNTNGSANLTQGRDVTLEMEGVFDRVSVSVNVADAAAYERLSRPEAGPRAWPALRDFVLGARRHVAEVEITAVELPGADAAPLEALAREWGVPLRLRPYIRAE